MYLMVFIGRMLNQNSIAQKLRQAVAQNLAQPPVAQNLAQPPPLRNLPPPVFCARFPVRGSRAGEAVCRKTSHCETSHALPPRLPLRTCALCAIFLRTRLRTFVAQRPCASAAKDAGELRVQSECIVSDLLIATGRGKKEGHAASETSNSPSHTKKKRTRQSATRREA
jgi:hypothetical protein